MELVQRFWLQSEGYEVFLSDAGTLQTARKEELEKYNVPFEELEHTFERLNTADLIVKSPGIPDSSEIVQKLKQASIPIISEIEFAFRHQSSTVLAITGSNGKTTTTHLCTHILNSLGFDVAAVGNVGVSFARQVATDPKACYVLEVSSFQLDGIVAFRPDVAVLLNITPDHMDRYDGEIEKYAQSKFRIALNQRAGDAFIYNGLDQGVLTHMGKGKIDATKIEINESMLKADGKVEWEGHEIDPAKGGLIGRHNQQNLICAIAAVAQLGVDPGKIQDTLETFKNDPHRLEFVRELDGVKYINDSKATNVDAVFFALEAIQDPIIWIAGGEDKGNDYGILLELVKKKVKALICLGLDNRKINEAFSTQVLDYRETTKVDEAVKWAASLASPRRCCVVVAGMCQF